MYIIGVYGRSGSGKSTFSKKLANDLGAVYVDVDKYWRKVYYSEEFQKIVVPFFKKNKDLKRPENAKEENFTRLKDLKVSSTQATIMRKLLYQYLNFRIQKKLRQEKNAKIVVIDHINLFKFDVFKKINFMIYVNTPSEICQKNIMKRDFITEERMKELVNNKIVEKHEEFENISHDFSISAFCENYDKKYQELFGVLTQNIKDFEKEKKENVLKIVNSKPKILEESVNQKP